MIQWIEDFYSALHQFKQNKGRTILSLLGIMIGILCVITISTLSNSLTESVKNIFASMNNRIMEVRSTIGFEESNLKLDDKYKKDLLENIDNIEKIILVQPTYASLVYNSTELEGSNIMSIDYGFCKALGFEFSHGSDFELNAYAEGLHHVILGENIANMLFNQENPIGKKIWFYFNNPSFGSNSPIQKLPKAFEVCGIIKANQTFMSNAANYILIPRSVLLREQLAGTNNDAEMMVVAKTEDSVNEVKTNIMNFTDNITGIERSLYIVSLEEQIQQIVQSLGIITLVLTAIGALSLLVGGIGIMNIMIVTVTERRQEIGIRKALGASKKNILTQFLVESVSITLLGSAMGSVLGFLTSFGLFSILNLTQRSTVPLTFAPDITSLCVAIIVSIILGIFFGLYPALQAAKLDPVLALEEV